MHVGPGRNGKEGCHGTFPPPQPDLEHLKNEAKALHKARARGDASACAVLRRLRRFADASDADVLASPVTLTEAQFALAMDYGFKSWDELRRTVLRTRPIAGASGQTSLLVVVGLCYVGI